MSAGDRTWSSLNFIFNIVYSIFNVILKVLSRAISQQKEVKGIQIGKEEVKISYLQMIMIVYLSEPKNSIREFLNLINNFSKVPV